MPDKLIAEDVKINQLLESAFCTVKSCNILDDEKQDDNYLCVP